MKDKTYLAINLNDFHSNQNGKPETNTQIKFFSAANLADAKRAVHTTYPHTAWFVIPKGYCDSNIVYSEN